MSIELLKILQAVQTIVLFFVPALLVGYFKTRKPWQFLCLNTFPWREVLLAMLLMILAQPCINMLADWNSGIQLPEFLAELEAKLQAQEEAAALLTEQFIVADNFGVLLINLLIMALLPAFCEETCFRAMLIRLISPDSRLKTLNLRLKTHLAIWISAFIFSAVHFQFYGFVPRMLMGAVFGYMLVWSDSLWVPIMAHLTNNSIAVIAYNICLYRGIDPETIDVVGTGDTLGLGILSGIITIGMVWVLYTQTKKRQSE